MRAWLIIKLKIAFSKRTPPELGGGAPISVERPGDSGVLG